MHVSLAHHCRRGERDAELWNRAADYAVNPILIKNGITLPKDALIDPALANLGAEEIYARLLKHEQDSGGSDPRQAPQSEPQSLQHPQDSPGLPGMSDLPLPVQS